MNHLIILAAGDGKRMKSKENKLLLEAGGNPILYYSIMAFHDHPDIESITVVAGKNDQAKIEALVQSHHFPRVKKIIVGGETRMQSLRKGLEFVGKNAKKGDIIIVHNGANPLPSQREIDELIEKTAEDGACIVGHYISSTVKEIDSTHVLKTHDRKKLFAAQTPQAAKYSLLKKALDNATKAKFEATDEAMLLEAIGQKVAYVEADENNFKITTQNDYERLKNILGDLPADFRIGIGQDSHMFEETKKGLTIAGITLEDELKLQANSDGDVVLHAIFNAISQALGQMSLGFYADEQCEKGVTDSKKYLAIILKDMKKSKFKINSLGVMIECKKPKIDPLVSKMKKSLAELLDLSPPRIGITATSGEELTAFGAGLGIQCFCIVSLRKA